MTPEQLLADVESLSNPHFLIVGADVARSAAQLLSALQGQVDVAIIGTQAGALYHIYGRKAEDVRQFSLGVKVLDEPSGREIGIAEILRVHAGMDEASRMTVDDIHAALAQAEQDRMDVGWGASVENGLRYAVEAESADGWADWAEADVYLHALGLPGVLREADGPCVILRDPRMGAGLKAYGLVPRIERKIRHDAFVQRCIALRETYPNAERSVIESVAQDEIGESLWELAAAKQGTAKPERDDSFGCGLLDAVTFQEVLKRFADPVHALIDGNTPLGGFLSGAIRYLDVSACSDARTSLAILSLLTEMHDQEFRGRWRLLVLDVPVGLVNASVWRSAQHVVRQGRKYGLGTVFLEPESAERICPEIRGDLGNWIGGGRDPQSLGFAPLEQDREIKGLASTLLDCLKRYWQHVADDQNHPIAEHFYSLHLGAFAEHDDDGLLWKPDAEASWLCFSKPSAIENRKTMSHEVWLAASKHAYYLFRRLSEQRQSYPKASFWWYNQNDGVSYALSSWK